MSEKKDITPVYPGHPADAGGRLVVQDEGGPEVAIAMYRGEHVLRIVVSREVLTDYAYRFLAASTRRAPV